MAKRATRMDVAKQAGVSAACVSLVMSGRGDEIGIAKGTQERIRNIAKELGYVPNSMMKSILRGRSHILGVFVGWEQWSSPQAYWMEITRGLQAAAAGAGQDLLIYSDAPGTTTEEIFTRQASGIVDGVLIEAGGDDLAVRISNSHLPGVTVGWVHPSLPSVSISSDEGVALLVNHLIGKGYKHLVYLDPQTVPSEPMEIRRCGYIRAVSDAGRPQDAERTLGMRSIDTVIDDLMAMSPKPEAVVCFNDLLAYMLLGACQERGIDVPGELAIVGFDGIPVPPGVRQITTVRSPILEMCRTGVSLLMEVIEGRPVPPLTELHVTELEPGTTT